MCMTDTSLYLMDDYRDKSNILLSADGIFGEKLVSVCVLGVSIFLKLGSDSVVFCFILQINVKESQRKIQEWTIQRHHGQH